MQKGLNLFALAALCVLVGAEPAFAAEGGSGLSAIGAGMVMGIAALGGTLGQSRAISAALDSIGRNPSAAGKLFTPMIIGLALIESLVIISFVIAFFLV